MSDAQQQCWQRPVLNGAAVTRYSAHLEAVTHDQITLMVKVVAQRPAGKTRDHQQQHESPPGILGASAGLQVHTIQPICDKGCCQLQHTQSASALHTCQHLAWPGVVCQACILLVLSHLAMLHASGCSGQASQVDLEGQLLQTLQEASQTVDAVCPTQQKNLRNASRCSNESSLMGPCALHLCTAAETLL